MTYTGIYDARLFYDEAQEARLSEGQLPSQLRAQIAAMQAGFPDALASIEDAEKNAPHTEEHAALEASAHAAAHAALEASAHTAAHATLEASTPTAAHAALEASAPTAAHAHMPEEAISIPGYPHPLHAGKQRGTVIVIPGGGYSWLSPREADPIVHAFNAYGFRALVFHYDCESEILGLRPLKQAAWAVAKTRQLFPEEPIYLCGFSAGAHVAASIGIHFDDTDWNGDPLFSEVLDFLGEKAADPSVLFHSDGLILCYPVISAGEYRHAGSFERLLGKREDFIAKYGDDTDYERARRWFSLETQVHDSTPKTFVWQTVTDESVPVQNSLLLVNALVEHGIPVEYHLYPKGPHGLSLATEEVAEASKNRVTDLHVADWFERAIDWLLYTEDETPRHI